MKSSPSKNDGATSDSRLGLVIHEVSRLRRVAVNRRLKPLGITRSQGYILGFLARRDGMSQTALAEDLDMTRVAISGLIGRMESMGLVQRKDDEYDARIRRVFLTREGYRLSRQIMKLVDQFDYELLSPTDDADLATTLNTLTGIKQRLVQMIGNGRRESGDSEDD